MSKERDEKAKEYGLVAAIHSWKRMPDHIDGSPRAKPTRPDIFTESAYRRGWDQALESEAVKNLIEALKFYTLKSNYSTVDEGRNYHVNYVTYELNENTYADEELGSRAKEALIEFEKAKETK